MTYQNFKEIICAMVEERLNGQADITVHDIVKNNGKHRDGLIIVSHQSNLSPTLYLDYYYSKYQEGASLSAVCEEILSSYRSNSIARNIDVSFFTSYDKVKSHIVLKLVNYEKNSALLAKIPHRRFLDLAVIFCCFLDAGSTASGNILIYNHHLAFWDITADDLYALAIENTPRLLRHELFNLGSAVKELCQQNHLSDFDAETFNELCPMYILTNHRNMNGAACILYQNLLKETAAKLGSDLYIIPSSIHEVILLPVGKSSREELTQMVQDVNEKEILDEEILSDHVYYFCRETGQITI